jgi:glycine cleavage system H protein
MNFPKELRYCKSHEWVKFLNETTALVGITDFAQSELGSIVFVNLPEEGDEFQVGETFADVESVKAVSDIYSPLAGSISKVNEELADAPEMINEDPYAAWFVEITNITATDEFLEAHEYEAFIKEGN